MKAASLLSYAYFTLFPISLDIKFIFKFIKFQADLGLDTVRFEQDFRSSARLNGASNCYQISPSAGGDRRAGWGSGNPLPLGTWLVMEGGYMMSPASSWGVLSRPLGGGG